MISLACARSIKSPQHWRWFYHTNVPNLERLSVYNPRIQPQGYADPVCYSHPASTTLHSVPACACLFITLISESSFALSFSHPLLHIRHAPAKLLANLSP